MSRRRIILIVVVLALLVGVSAIVWQVNDWPPIRLILEYGFPPAGGPTGNLHVIEGIEFVELKPGYFRMGSHYHCEMGDLLGRISSVLGLSWGTPPVHHIGECPTRWVEIGSSLWIAKTEVTNTQYERFDSRHRRWSSSEADRGPVVNVTWDEASAFCEWLSRKSGLSVRLPSESEWEAACRAGSSSEFCFGDEEARLHEYAWSDENSGGGAHEVGTRKANDWGLLDFHGNACEWCMDPHHSGHEGTPGGGNASKDGRNLLSKSPIHVIRGGCWYDRAEACRSAARDSGGSRYRLSAIGFRPVISIAGE